MKTLETPLDEAQHSRRQKDAQASFFIAEPPSFPAHPRIQRPAAPLSTAHTPTPIPAAHPEGELQASEKLLQAAQRLAQQPQAMQLRYLQTLTTIAADKNSTIVFPLPIDLLGALLDRLGGSGRGECPAPCIRRSAPLSR